VLGKYDAAEVDLLIKLLTQFKKDKSFRDLQCFTLNYLTNTIQNNKSQYFLPINYYVLIVYCILCIN
jgi:hypothetical protein